jgi:flagellar protein FlaG
MQSSITTTSAISPDPAFDQNTAPQPAESGPASGAGITQKDPADLRLVIEEDKASSSYVYKTVNRVTGEVIGQFPREQLLRLRDDPIYEAGDVIRAKA